MVRAPGRVSGVPQDDYSAARLQRCTTGVVGLELLGQRSSLRVARAHADLRDLRQAAGILAVLLFDGK